MRLKGEALQESWLWRGEGLQEFVAGDEIERRGFAGELAVEGLESGLFYASRHPKLDNDAPCKHPTLNNDAPCDHPIHDNDAPYKHPIHDNDAPYEHAKHDNDAPYEYPKHDNDAPCEHPNLDIFLAKSESWHDKQYSAISESYGSRNGRIRSFGYGDRNEEGHTIIEFATAHDLMVENSFMKTGAHLITFQNEGHNTQFDYLLVRKGDLRTCKDCRVFPEGLSTLVEECDAKQMWNILVCSIKEAVKDSLGVASGFQELLLFREGHSEDRDMIKERNNGLQHITTALHPYAATWNYCCVSLIVGLDLSKLAIILNSLRKIYSKGLTSGDDNGDHLETYNTSPPVSPPTQQIPHTVSSIKVPILKKGEYDIWAMKMEYYLSHTDYPIWKVMHNGNGPVSDTTDTNGIIKVVPPKMAEEVVARERERKVRTTLLMALPEDHLAKFHKMADEKEMREAIKSRYNGNDESKKMQNYLLKQQFMGFFVSTSEGLHKGYDRFRTLLSQLEIYGAGVSHEDANQKFIRAKENQDRRRRDVRYNGNKTRDNGRRPVYQDDSKDLVTIDEEDIDWSGHVEEDAQNYAMMAYFSNNLGSDNEVKSCSKACEESYAKVKKLYDDQRDKLGDASVEITAYTLTLKKASDLEDTPVNDRFADRMHAVPPPITGNYMPSRPDVEIVYSKFTYGPKQTSANESDSKPSEYASCESDSSIETSTSMPKPVENASKVVCEPKMWTDALIIEEYESNSYNDSVSNVQEDKEKPSFAFTDSVKHVKTSRENIKETGTTNHSHIIEKQDRYGQTRKSLGYAFTRKACFVCGNKAHLVDYQEFKGGSVAFGACLFAKASIDESNKWHGRLGYVNFKNLNKLVKGNLVRDLPSKIFENDHTCVACQKGKQHKASCKAKT
nr:ribonuclease H-like domain-containing protein [Tanacetum cinerariifolium]